MKNKKSNWDIVKGRSFTDTPANRDVYNSQSLERGKQGQKTSPKARRILSIIVSIIVTIGSVFLISILMGIADIVLQLSRGNSVAGVAFNINNGLSSWKAWGSSVLIGFMVWGILYNRMMANWRSENSMNDTTDINPHMNDQYIMLPDEAIRTFDYFPDVGAHSSVNPTMMISHINLSNKGLKKVPFTQRYSESKNMEFIDEDTGEKFVDRVYEGEAILDLDGNPVSKMMPIIDEQFGQDLMTASGIPDDAKEIREPFDVSKIPYNQADKKGKRPNREKQKYDGVVDLINQDWEIPDYEVQRPSGAYLVETDAINTMVWLALRVW